MFIKRCLQIFLVLDTLAMMAAGAAAPLAVADTIAERVKPCLACHGPEGRVGKDAYYPRLAGKPAGYLYNQLLNFRQGRRHSRPMNMLLVNLSDAYLAEMAAYFSAQHPRYAAAGGGVAALAPALINDGDPARKLPACVACHGKELLGFGSYIPGLVGLPADYISAQFGSWKAGTRHAGDADCMGQIAKQLDTVEVAAIAAWLASRPLAVNAHPAASLPAPLPMRCGSVHGEGSAAIESVPGRFGSGGVPSTSPAKP
jgi:cytochrome c553